MNVLKRSLPSLAGLAVVACATAPHDAVPTDRTDAGPTATYRVYVGAESADRIHRVRFGPDGAAVEKTTEIGELPVETEGPHGLAVSADGRALYMTTGHGVPDGKLWTFDPGPDTLVSEPTLLGRFPATVSVTPDGLYAFVANFNLHGEAVPSTISVVYTPDLTEVARTTTCTQPHGSRIAPDGTRHYSVCVQDDQLVEIDTRTFDVTRRFRVAPGREGPLPAEDATGTARPARSGAEGAVCGPTWAQPSTDGERVYVACNKNDEILEISVSEWRVLRRFPTGGAPYNLAVTPDGERLVATLKKDAAVQVFDLESGESLGRTASTTTLTHGVAVSPDSRFAFVSSEGVGAEPGRVDVHDLETLERVASVKVGQQAGGIAFWSIER